MMGRTREGRHGEPSEPVRESTPNRIREYVIAVLELNVIAGLGPILLRFQHAERGGIPVLRP
jgi:hypothetical protein